MSQFDQPQQPAYQPPQAPPSYSAAPQQQTNPLALTALIASLVSPAAWILSLVPVIGSILSILAPISAILAVVFGHIALSQIKKRGGGGRGMALTGLIIGYILIGVSIIIGILIVAVFGAIATGFGVLGAY